MWGHLMGLWALPTSSSLKAIMETARKTASVEPVMVVMRSGQDPSEMVMRALLWGQCHTPSGVVWALCSVSPPKEGLTMGDQCLWIWAFPLPPAAFLGMKLCFPWVHPGLGGAGLG